MNNTRPKIAVVGCGRMGAGIAQAFAYEGFEVDLIDAKKRDLDQAHEALATAYRQISLNLSFLSTLHVLEEQIVPTILSRINLINHDFFDPSLAGADFIFEAVPEVLEIKEAAFEKISRHAGKEAIIASTTSTFLADSLAEYVTYPDRFMNSHWLNPAYLMPLVEISPGQFTSSRCVDQMFKLLESIGKLPVKCHPSPGFIVPRIQALAMNEAARLVEEGVATPEDIDKASRFGFGLRFVTLGLLEFIDWGGGDILYYASNYLKEALNEERFSPPKVVVQNMEDDHIGIKSGKGFFDYSHRDMERYQQETITKFVDLLKHLELIRPPKNNC